MNALDYDWIPNLVFGALVLLLLFALIASNRQHMKTLKTYIKVGESNDRLLAAKDGLIEALNLKSDAQEKLIAALKSEGESQAALIATQREYIARMEAYRKS